MISRVIVTLALLGLAASVSIQKRAEDKYGSTGAAAQPATYNVGAAQPQYSAAAPSYSSSGANYNAAGSSYSSNSAYSMPASDAGNLYYYYYPVTNSQPYASNQYPATQATTNPLDIFGLGSLDMNSLIIPLLLLGGVLLLLPAILGCDLQNAVCTIPLPFGGTGRRRRDLDGMDGPVTLQENIDAAFNLYMAAMEGEVCMKRVMCELGRMMKEVKGKSTIFGLVDNFVPSHLQDGMKALKTGAMENHFEKYSSGQCEVFKCNSKRLFDKKQD